MQPIQNVVEQLITRNLTAETSFSLAQVGINVFFELLFRQFGWNFAHDGRFLGQFDRWVVVAPIMRADFFPVNSFQMLKLQTLKSLNEFKSFWVFGQHEFF